MRMLKIVFLIVIWCVSAIVFGANANAQVQNAKMVAVSAEAQQPLQRDYRAVRLGMTTEEARAKLGSPVLRGDDQDFFVFSENETAQIGYNSAHRVMSISTDYTKGIGAPDYRLIIGGDLLVRPDGSLYRIVHYDSEGFWVSYNKSAGTVSVVTVTFQVAMK